MLLVGAGLGWFMRDTADSGGGGTIVTVVGVTVPADLDQFAPLQRIASPPNPAVFDPATIIGLDPTGTLDVPATRSAATPTHRAA